MPDWKFYVTSLVAVFLALGIGILIGSMLIGDEAVLSQQSNMLAQLEADLLSLKETNSRLRAELQQSHRELERARSVASQILPRLLDRKLEGRAVAVVGADKDLISDLRTWLANSGAVVSVATLQSGQVPWSELAAQLGLAPETLPERLSPLLGRYLGQALIGENRVPDSILESADHRGWWVQELAAVPAEILVIVDPGQTNRQSLGRTILVSLARYWHDHRGPVVATGRGDERSLAPYRRAEAITVEEGTDPWSRAELIATLAAL
ncbi:MAG: copper transporter [Moorellales bacterium]